jgi:hypothetical protein
MPHSRSSSTKRSPRTATSLDPVDIALTDDDVESWAERERARRQQWASGPTDNEKREWALAEYRARVRYAPPYGSTPPSAAGPTDEEVDEWAAKEHARRESWLEGPTESERLEWARQEREHRTSRIGAPVATGPTDEEVAAWADEERLRRQAWLQGPTQAEKAEYAQVESERRRWAVPRPYGYEPYGYAPYGYAPYGAEGSFAPWMYVYAGGWGAYGPRYPAPDYETARQFGRSLELAGRGAWYLLTEGPYVAWERLLEAGRTWEEQAYQPAPRQRISLYY